MKSVYMTSLATALLSGTTFADAVLNINDRQQITKLTSPIKHGLRTIM